MKISIVMLIALIAFFLPLVVVADQEEAPPAAPQEETQPAVAEETPAANMVKIEKHWSKYVYPEEVPADVKIHVIERGDTLWDLAGKFLNNNFLWPQIWEANKYISDAHWIYPGDPLIIPIPAEVSGEQLAQAEGELEGEMELPEVGKEEGEEFGEPEYIYFGMKRRPLIIAGDIMCSGYILNTYVAYKYRILAAERQMHSISYSTDDIVYIDGGELDGIKPGDRFIILHPDNEVADPVTYDHIGTMVRKAGVLTVVATQEHTATAQIESSCFPASIGDFLEPFAEPKIPVVMEMSKIDRYAPVESQLRGRIIYSDVQTVGNGTTVFIDRGTGDGVEIGSRFLIYRKYHQGYYGDEIKLQIPEVILGELIVIETQEHISAAKIMISFDYIVLGDSIAMR
ncbi:MAG: hypothetical protein A2Y62_14205 [Candidatus Fischerbacteria bacterium RBG_13_37_8]|uniref:LysM domain-containing protein n=1 Tax=Candidatus Fischerbacteria bacterium RBG_13_37_8 TaxID=1817863 RepID=A0A1F5VVM8_9BACT|nr:MAG: hypothetical protein A2Y62_14205 [Candidatus Fischerbacteria bacterium RBG_13_37_8]